MGSIRPMLQAFTEELSFQMQLKVLMDPQPIGVAEPHIRLTFTGTEVRESYCHLQFQISVVGAGDGPEVFLERVIAASAAIAQLASKRNPRASVFSYMDTTCRYSLEVSSSATGQFMQNEKDESEQTLFSYTYVEPHTIVLQVPISLITR